ncbi:short-chain dehydrogenase/reductase [Mycolicibacterium llatzerense]|uniref:short-chain dehydrogenase/reductase n=1 Tax=Mycolicibacterium llatzerense TaxID=280871 RepID=UPI0005C777A1|nr:short-chain dehydrogenase/reductase [Mycolicibacterium llatzerense]
MNLPWPRRAHRWDLTDKVVAITGAAAGIGEATARLLVNEGAQVALIDRDETALRRVAASLDGSAVPFVADVTDASALDQAMAQVIERLGGIDVVVANAGIVGPVKTFAAMTAEEFDRVIEVNVRGVAHTVRAALPSILERKGYALVIASAAAAIPTPTISAYGVSKAGVEALGRSLRMEITETGATAGVAYFGLIDTGMVRNDLLGGTGLEAVMAPLPKWFSEPAPVDAAARAIVDGIKRRARQIYAPRYLPLLLALRTTIALAEPIMARSTQLRAAIRQANVTERHDVETRN